MRRPVPIAKRSARLALSIAAFLVLAIANSSVAWSETTRGKANNSSYAAHPNATVAVDFGEKVVGGGAFVHSTGAGNILTASFPTSATEWTASSKDHGQPNPATVSAYAIALKDPNDDWEVIVRTATSSVSPWPTQLIAAPSGYVMTGGGCKVNWTQGQYGNLLVASYPSSDTTWACRASEHMSSSPASVTAYVIAIKPRDPRIPLPKNRIDQVTSGPASQPEATVTPPLEGYVITGGGANATDQPINSPKTGKGSKESLDVSTAVKATAALGAGRYLTRSSPVVDSSGQVIGWIARAKDHIVPKPGPVTVYAVSVQFPPKLSGYEIVSGPSVEIAPLGLADVQVLCPIGKVAINVGFNAAAHHYDDRKYGIELKAAWPDGRSGRVRIRNANVIASVGALPHASCVDDSIKIRAVDIQNDADSETSVHARSATCDADEQLIGGGFSSELEAYPVGGSPTQVGYLAQGVKASPLPGVFVTRVRALCAPRSAAWYVEHVSSGLQTLSGRSASTLQINCSRGRHLLSSGLFFGGGKALAAVLFSHNLRSDRSAGFGATALVANRDLAGASVTLGLEGICARVE